MFKAGSYRLGHAYHCEDFEFRRDNQEGKLGLGGFTYTLSGIVVSSSQNQRFESKIKGEWKLVEGFTKVVLENLDKSSFRTRPQIQPQYMNLIENGEFTLDQKKKGELEELFQFTFKPDSEDATRQLRFNRRKVSLLLAFHGNRKDSLSACLADIYQLLYLVSRFL